MAVHTISLHGISVSVMAVKIDDVIFIADRAYMSYKCPSCFQSLNGV